MAQCHLSHKIPWDTLKSCMGYYKSGIFLPVGECGKIHCNDRATQIKVDNRKYIVSTDICDEPNCKTVGKKSFLKKKNETPVFFSKFRKELDDSLNKQFKYFCDQFINTVFEFIEKEKDREDEVSDSYIETCDLSEFVDGNINCTECYGPCHRKFCNNFVVFNLFISGKINILMKLDKINRIDVRKALSQYYGGQAVGNGFAFLMYHVKLFYLVSNAIIICGLQNDPTNWGLLSPSNYFSSSIQHDCDYKTFIPTLRPLLHKDIFMKNPVETHKLLKETFRCIYQYVYLQTKFFNFTKEELYDDLISDLSYVCGIKTNIKNICN